MTPPPSSAASFCDAAAILPSLYLATARILPCPAVASRLVDAPDAAPPRPAIALAVAPDAALPRPVVAVGCPAIVPAIVLPLPFCCYRAAVALPGGCPARPSRFAPIAPYRVCRRAAPRPAVAPEVVLQDKQHSGVALPCLAVALPTAIATAVIPLSAQPSRHPAIALLPSARRSTCCHRPTVVVLLGLPVLPLSAAAPCCLAVAALPCYC